MYSHSHAFPIGVNVEQQEYGVDGDKANPIEDH